uniref:HPBS desulfinase n=1 Tax=Rhodococcus erythropolis TaxID=1833 RepID=X2FZZ9_RHOER|nr:HPBS desulfinase [Rhodococcus erythropolis]
MTSGVDPANLGSEIISAFRETLSYSNGPVPNARIMVSELGFLNAPGIEFEVLSGHRSRVHSPYGQPSYTRFGGEIPPLLSEGLRAPGATGLFGFTPPLGRQGFFVRDESPITGAADLAGRRIGVSASAIRILGGQLGDYLESDPWRQTVVTLGSWEAGPFLHTLEHGELGVDDVELVPISSPGVDVPAEQLEESATVKGADLFPDVARGQAAVLASGDVDALYSWLPWAGELQATGARPVVDLGLDERNAYASVWTVSSGLVRQRPGLVQRLVDAAVDAGLWARDHSDAVTSLHAANLGVSTGAVGQGFGADFQQRLVPRLDHDALALLERTQQFLLTNNLLQEPVALDQWAAPEFLNNSLNRHR